MQVAKLSISLPETLVKFMEDYKVTHHCKSRSQVVEVALQLLREQELESAYRESSQEIDLDWELTVADGLTDEAW